MAAFNSASGYGGLTKLLHWLTVGLFAFQYSAAAIMLRTGPEETSLGITQAAYFNWHKTIGLFALVVAVARLINRRAGEMPPWAPSLSPLEQRTIHRAEQLLYAAMLAMPLSGFVYCMAGGYGVLLFGSVALPNPIGEWPFLAKLARWVHIAAGFALLLPLGTHIGLVLAHHFLLGDRLIRRMLPRRAKDPRA